MIGDKRKRDEASVEATVFEVVKRLKHEESSRMGSITEARMMKDMIKEEKLIEDPDFDEALQKIQTAGDFWVEDDPPSKFLP